MKNKLWNLKRQVFVALLVACACGVPVPAQMSEASGSADPSSRNTIQGAWMTVVTRRDCATGAVLGSFNGLQTFNFGGTVAETAATPGGPSLRGPGHGTWERLQNDSFASAFIFIRYNPDGTFAGWQRIRSEHLLNENGDQWTATASFDVLAPNGMVVASGCVTAVGVRFE